MKCEKQHEKQNKLMNGKWESKRAKDDVISYLCNSKKGEKKSSIHCFCFLCSMRLKSKSIYFLFLIGWVMHFLSFDDCRPYRWVKSTTIERKSFDRKLFVSAPQKIKRRIETVFLYIQRNPFHIVHVMKVRQDKMRDIYFFEMRKLIHVMFPF